jgi:hypothetical protein
MFYDSQGKTRTTEIIVLFYRLNTFRLWTVQLFAIIKEYETEFSLDGDVVDSNLCDMIEHKVNKSTQIIFNNSENSDVLCEAVSCMAKFLEKCFCLFILQSKRI